MNNSISMFYESIQQLYALYLFLKSVRFKPLSWQFEAACDGEGSEVGNAKDWVSEGDNAKDWTSEGGNVEVDQTPLHNMIDKNKQCK